MSRKNKESEIQGLTEESATAANYACRLIEAQSVAKEWRH